MKLTLTDGSAVAATFGPAHQVQRVSKPLPDMNGYASVEFLGNGYATETVFSQEQGFWSQTTFYNGSPAKMVFKDLSYGRVFAYTYGSDGLPSTVIASIPRSTGPVNRSIMTTPPVSIFKGLEQRPQSLLRRRSKTTHRADVIRSR